MELIIAVLLVYSLIVTLFACQFSRDAVYWRNTNHENIQYYREREKQSDLAHEQLERIQDILDGDDEE